MVLKCSPDLLNNVRTGLGQLRLIMKPNLFHYIWGLWQFWSSDLKQSRLMNTPSNSPVISEKKMFSINALRIKFDLAISRSRSTKIHHMCKPGGADIPNATYKVPRPLAFWFQRRYLKGFYHI